MYDVCGVVRIEIWIHAARYVHFEWFGNYTYHILLSRNLRRKEKPLLLLQILSSVIKHKIVVAFSNTQKKFWSSPTSKSWKSIFLFIRLLQCQLSSSQLAILPRLDDRMVSAWMHYSTQYWITFGMTVRLTYN